MRVFAYGSNLDMDQLRERAPSATRLGLGELRDHRFAFTRRSAARRGGVADVLSARGFVVFGAVFEIKDDELPALDRSEGVLRTPPGYRRVTLPIVLYGTRGGSVPGEVYQVVAPAAVEIAPHAQYAAQILNGLRAARAVEVERLGSADFIQVRRLDDYLAFVRWLCGLAGEHSDDQQSREFVRPGALVIRTNARRGRGKCGPVIQVSPRSVAASAGTAVLRANGFDALAEVRVAEEVLDGYVAVDQTLRAALGLRGQQVFGYTAEILPTQPRALGTVPVRSLTLRLAQARAADIERSLCILHPRNLEALGVEPGDHVELIRPIHDGVALRPRKLTLRCSAAGTGVGVDYPSVAEVYLDEQCRDLFGVGRGQPYLGMPILVRPSLRRALQKRVAVYGITVLLAISALIDLLSRLTQLSDVWVGVLAVLLAAVITVSLAVSDIRSKLQP